MNLETISDITLVESAALFRDISDITLVHVHVDSTTLFRDIRIYRIHLT